MFKKFDKYVNKFVKSKFLMCIARAAPVTMVTREGGYARRAWSVASPFGKICCGQKEFCCV